MAEVGRGTGSGAHIFRKACAHQNETEAAHGVGGSSLIQRMPSGMARLWGKGSRSTARAAHQKVLGGKRGRRGFSLALLD